MKLASVDILYCKSHLNEPIEGLSNLSGFWVFFVLLDHLEKNNILHAGSFPQTVSDIVTNYVSKYCTSEKYFGTEK